MTYRILSYIVFAVYVMMQENRRIAIPHYVRMYVRKTGEFEVQEIGNM